MSQLKGGLIPSSQLNSRPSDGEDKAALMSLRFCWVSVREACSGRNSLGFFSVFCPSLGHLN